MGYYNVEDYVRQKKQHAKEISVPPRANLLAAANHLRGIFETKKLAYGFTGSLEMLCLGYRREMPDLQIAYDDRDFQRIRAKLEADQRIRLPQGINSLFPARLLVRTGPAFKDKDCTHSGDIEVDLIPPGSHGTPPSGELAKNIVLLSLKTDGKLKTFKGLNMLYLVKTLGEFCRVTDLAWDPRKDMLFLCQHYGEQVESIRSQLDQRATKQNFLGTPFFSRLSPEDQRKCYQVLLGSEPPPVMAVTPPAPSLHKYSSSAPDVSVPRSRSHNVSASLVSPELLSPPISSKPKSSHIAPSTVRPPPAQTQQSDSSSAARESRSRYRNVSAPSSQDISPVDLQTATTKHLRQHSQPPSIVYNTSPRATGAYISQLPPHIAFNASTQSTQGTGSMPNLNAGLCDPAPSYAFNQMPTSASFGRLPQVTHNHVSPVEMAASPVTASPGQRSMKSPIGMSAIISQQQPIDNVSMMSRPRPPRNKSPREVLVSEISVLDRPRPPRTKTFEDEPTRAELSGTPMLEERVLQLHVVNPDVAQPVQHTKIAEPKQPLSPVELDAMSELKQFIAELSVERSTPAPQSTSSNIPDSLLMDKSVVYPRSSPSGTEPQDSMRNLASVPHDHHEDIPIRPLKTRTTSAPIGGLPTSLRPGGLTSHSRTTSTCSGTTPPTTADAMLHYTNASKYTNLTAPSTPPPSQPTSPQPTYVAYNPSSVPALPLSPPATFEPASTTSSTYKDGQEQVDSPTSPDSPERSNRFSTLMDVDGAGGYFKDKHRRDRSADTRALAMEYQAELPVFGEGY